MPSCAACSPAGTTSPSTTWSCASCCAPRSASPRRSFRWRARGSRSAQIKGSGGRHEKDDRTRIDARSQYVLGWTNERKISALLRRATALQEKQNELAAAQQQLKDELDQAIDRGQLLAGLDETREFADIDWQTLVNRVEDLKAEKTQLEAASSELERLNRKLETVRNDIAEAEAEQGAGNKKLGGLGTEIDTARGDLAEARHPPAQPDS